MEARDASKHSTLCLKLSSLLSMPDTTKLLIFLILVNWASLKMFIGHSGFLFYELPAHILCPLSNSIFSLFSFSTTRMLWIRASQIIFGVFLSSWSWTNILIKDNRNKILEKWSCAQMLQQHEIATKVSKHLLSFPYKPHCRQTVRELVPVLWNALRFVCVCTYIHYM